MSATGCQSVAPDLPGFGVSPAPSQAWGAPDYAAAVAEHLLGGDEPPYVVIGHSFGGRIAVCMAANHPESVAGVVLMGVPLLRARAAKRPSLRYRVVRSAARVGLVSPDRLEAARQRHGSVDYRAASGVMREVLVRVVREDYRMELNRIRCPVALVWGAADDVVPFSVASAAAAELDRIVALDAVEGAGHDVHIEAQARVEEAIAAVVAEAA